MHAVVPTSIVVEGVPTELVGTGVPTSFVVAIPTRLVGTAYNRKSCVYELLPGMAPNLMVHIYILLP